MQIDKWMKRHVHTVRPLDSIAHAREIMASNRVNQLPVVNGPRLLGIITDRDLRDAFPSVFEELPPAKAGDPKNIKVEEVMTTNVLTLGPKASITEAAQLMRNERIGAIPIVDAGHLIGILARSDVLDAFVALLDQTAV
jgi:acetoin utilization protein AcuB